MVARAHAIMFTYDPGDTSRVACQWLVSEEVFDTLKEELNERMGPPQYEHYAPPSLLDQIRDLPDTSVTLATAGGD